MQSGGKSEICLHFFLSTKNVKIDNMSDAKQLVKITKIIHY